MTEIGLALIGFSQRVRDRVLTWMVRGAFERFGRSSTVVSPIRLAGSLRGVSVGTRVYIGAGSWIQTLPSEETPDPKIVIGDRVLASGILTVSAAREVVIEDAVLFARNVYVSDHIHRFDGSEPVRDQGVTKVGPVRIGRGAWLGQNVVVCPGVTIGEGAVIGAGSLVNTDVPPRSLAVGSPARVVKTL